MGPVIGTASVEAYPANVLEVTLTDDALQGSLAAPRSLVIAAAIWKNQSGGAGIAHFTYGDSATDRAPTPEYGTNVNGPVTYALSPFGITGVVEGGVTKRGGLHSVDFLDLKASLFAGDVVRLEWPSPGYWGSLDYLSANIHVWDGPRLGTLSLGVFGGGNGIAYTPTPPAHFAGFVLGGLSTQNVDDTITMVGADVIDAGEAGALVKPGVFRGAYCYADMGAVTSGAELVFQGAGPPGVGGTQLVAYGARAQTTPVPYLRAMAWGS